MAHTLTIPLDDRTMKALRAYAALHSVTLQDAAAELLWDRLLDTLSDEDWIAAERKKRASGLPKDAVA